MSLLGKVSHPQYFCTAFCMSVSSHVLPKSAKKVNDKRRSHLLELSPILSGDMIARNTLKYDAYVCRKQKQKLH